MAREYQLDTFPTLTVIHEGIQIGGLEHKVGTSSMSTNLRPGLDRS